jgi:hypothetical protein
MQGRPLWETSHLTFLARHDKHALGALFLILACDLGLGSIVSVSAEGVIVTDDLDQGRLTKCNWNLGRMMTR